VSRPEPRECIEDLERIARRNRLPDFGELNEGIRECVAALRAEDPDRRPTDRRGLPGGLVFLGRTEYYVIVPDLHARMDFFLKVMTYAPRSGAMVIEDLAADRAQVICVGDAFHSERRGIGRWQKAYQEFIGDFQRHENMDEEMMENLGLLEMIARVKRSYPENFHFLKGNHENIANERGEGNYPFVKFVQEGEMVRLWMNRFAGPDLPGTIYQWEKALPLMAAGSDFLVTHAEPGRTLSLEEVINAYSYPDVIYQLTWVGNDEAAPGSVRRTLSNIIGPGNGRRIFGGHRPVDERYDLRQDGDYVQINTPDRHVIALFSSMEDFDPERSIMDI
jgi:hypothetical protein